MKKLLALLLCLLMPFCALADEATPESPAMALLGEAMDAKTLPKAIALVEQAASLEPQSADTLATAFQVMLWLDEEGRYPDELRSLLDRIVALGDEEAENLISRCVEAAALSGRALELTDYLEELLREKPDSANYRYALSEALYYGGKTEEALALLSAPQTDESLTLSVLRASLYFDLRRWDDALAAYETIAESFPGWMAGPYGLFETYRACGDFERAARALDGLLTLGAGDDVWLDRARLRLWNCYQPEQALEEADALIRYDPEWVDARAVRVSALLLLERYDEALAEVDEIQTRNAAYAQLLRILALVNADRWDEAREVATAVEADSPYAPLAQMYLSLVESEGFGDGEAALRALGRAFEGGAAERAPADAYLYLGHAYRWQGDTAQAARAYAMSNQCTSDDTSALYYLALSCEDAGLPDELEKTLAEMELSYPGWYETLAARLVALYMAGDWQEALAVYETIDEKFPFFGKRLTMTHAVLLARTGDADGARALADAFLADAKNVDCANLADDAFLYALAGDEQAAADALARAEACLASLGAAGDIRDAAVGLETVRAQICLLSGDKDGCFAALSRAKEAGWPPRQALLWAEFESLAGDPRLDALLEGADANENWNLQLPPLTPSSNGKR